MSIQRYKQFICYLFIAILLTSGMCIQPNDSHSYFPYEFSTTSKTAKYEYSKSIITSDYCTNELLQRNPSHYIKNNSIKRSSLRRTQNLILVNLDSVLKQNLFNFEDCYLTKALSSISSKKIIIDYIHRQDGAK